MTGAEAVIRCLEAEGVEICFGIPGGAILPIYDALAHSSSTASSTSSCATSRAPATWRRATRAPPARSASPGDLGPGRDEPRDAGRRRLPRLDADGRRDRAGADAPDRHRRLPGGRHDRHLHADRQALVPDPDARGHPALLPRGVPHRVDRPPRPGAGRRAEGRRAGRGDVPLAGTTSTCRATARRATATRCRCRRRPRRSPTPNGPCSTSAAASSTPRRTASCSRSPRRHAIPVVTTLMAKGAFPDSHPLSLQMPGMHGSKFANWALHQADLLVAIGARFDDRVTGKLDAFAPGARVIHMRHRPGGDLEEPPRRHPDRRRAARRCCRS